MKAILRILLLAIPSLANGQFIVSGGATLTLSPDASLAISANGFTIASTAQLSVAGSGKPSLIVSNSGSLVNNNASFDFSALDMAIELNGGAQAITGNFVLKDLSLTSPGPKTVAGNLTITNSLTFAQGILTPSPAAKILYTGSTDNLNGASDASYVEGAFYNGGPDSNKKFPIGINNTFAGAFLKDGSGEVGMLVHNTSANLSFAGNAELLDVNTDRYWEILTDVTQINSQIGLSLNGLDAFTANSAVSVVQSDAVGGEATNLSGAGDQSYVVSRGKVSAPIVTLGKEASIKVVIHDLITPFTLDTKNDFLYVEHIDHFDYNTVTLLDRWGVEVKKWVNFTNYDDPINPNTDGFDFTRLSPGNYICIVEYGKSGGKTEKISQMITVLKTY